MNKNLAAGIGALLILVGLIWTLQGLDILKSSSPMTGVTYWAIIGPLVAIAGIYLVARAVRARR